MVQKVHLNISLDIMMIGYHDDGVTRPLCIKLPQMIRYVKCFDSNKSMYENEFKYCSKSTVQKIY